jgi:LysM repeat protein
MAIQPSKRLALVLLIAVAVILGACTRSASTPPAATEEGEEGTPSGLTSQQMTMEAVRNDLLTQTAVAEAGGEEEATATPEPTEETTAEATATEAATEAPAGAPATYTLKAGEHPYCIARRFDVDPNALLNENAIDRSTPISPGLTLTIPEGTSGFPPPRALREHPTTYTVGSGETIYSIACLFGDVSPEAIAQANGLSEPYEVSSGTVLDIP